jgi:DNA-binding CsgD family transcriptional regulator
MTSRTASIHPAGADPPGALNRRDVEVLRCLAEGGSTARIAAVLSVSSNTARTRIRRVQHKLDVSGREAAVWAAHDLGVLPAR